MGKIDFSTPQRQSIFGILFFLALAIRKLITAFWPLFILLVFKGGENAAFEKYGYLALILVSVLLVVHSFLSYQNFFFYIDKNEFILTKGYLKKVIIAIPMDKIVSINLNQNLVQQLIGVVELEIDSAGSKNKEIKISALSKDVAAKLETLLSVYKQETTDRSEEPDEETSSQNMTTVFRYELSDLIRVGLTRNHLRGITILIVFGFNFLQQFDELFKDEIETAARETENFIAHSNITIFVAFAVFLIVLSFGISMIETILFYFKLSLKRSETAFTLTSGLLKRKNITIPFSRIQAFRQSINPLQKLAGISTLSLSQANSSERTKKKEKVSIPGCNEMVYRKTKAAVFGEKGFDNFRTFLPHIALLRRWIIFAALIPAIFSCLLLIVSWWYIILSFAILVFGLFTSWLIWRKRSYQLNERFLILKHGSFASQLAILELFKIQTIDLKQSPFQRYRNTATLHLMMAGTSISISEISMSEALEIKDYILYSIESSTRSWM